MSGSVSVWSAVGYVPRQRWFTVVDPDDELIMRAQALQKPWHPLRASAQGWTMRQRGPPAHLLSRSPDDPVSLGAFPAGAHSPPSCGVAMRWHEQRQTGCGQPDPWAGGSWYRAFPEEAM